MRASTPLILTAATVSALYLIGRREQKKLQAQARPDPRGPSRYDWTPQDIAQHLYTAKKETAEDHPKTHRYAVTLNPGLRGTRCVICGVFL